MEKNSNFESIEPQKITDVFGDEYDLDANGRSKVEGLCDWLLTPDR